MNSAIYGRCEICGASMPDAVNELCAECYEKYVVEYEDYAPVERMISNRRNQEGRERP